MEFLIGGVAAMCACVFSNPLEVVKIRMQLQGELKARGQHAVFYKNFAHGLWTIGKVDGILALQKGLVPAMWFQLGLNGLRLGIYQTVDNYGWTRSADGTTRIIPSIFYSAISGIVGAVVPSPFYLVKTQMQAYGDTSIAVGHQHKHEGMNRAMINIYKQSGIKGLYRGVTSSIPRLAFGSAAQLASFTLIKDYLYQQKAMADSPFMISFISSNIAGVAMALAMTPFDVMSTRLYNQGVDEKGRGLLYTGLWDCMVKTWKTEGILGFYKGLGPSYLRLGPHTVLTFLFWDKFREWYQKYVLDK